MQERESARDAQRICRRTHLQVEVDAAAQAHGSALEFGHLADCFLRGLLTHTAADPGMSSGGGGFPSGPMRALAAATSTASSSSFQLGDERWHAELQADGTAVQHVNRRLVKPKQPANCIQTPSIAYRYHIGTDDALGEGSRANPPIRAQARQIQSANLALSHLRGGPYGTGDGPTATLMARAIGMCRSG